MQLQNKNKPVLKKDDQNGFLLCPVSGNVFEEISLGSVQGVLNPLRTPFVGKL
ncbi:hypothetical protein SD77_2565 [Bacillus badius]|uniref:Uncharacterized protein n=1 Tax=Bacillus badius TaxID=1455 RepID=A0ABR5AZG9_BACBA|nr:hypothetical protein SD78_1980 [Bacillus badius]KIL80111.1 hypothetical protein SD77_2565 [Bacillus badius]